MELFQSSAGGHEEEEFPGLEGQFAASYFYTNSSGESALGRDTLVGSPARENGVLHPKLADLNSEKPRAKMKSWRLLC